MAEIQQLIFEILTRDRASEGFAKAGHAATAAAGDVSTLTRKLDEVGRKSATARVALAGDKEAQAALDRFDAKLVGLDRRTASARLTVEGAARALAEISAVDVALDKVGGQGGSAVAAAEDLGKLSGPSGMGALIAAGVALSPVLLTVGFGLGGLAAGAAGVIGPVLKASHSAGGLAKAWAHLDAGQRSAATSLLSLKSTYAGFEKTLSPAVLTDLGAATRFAGHMLADLEPVSLATGKALGGLLNRVDAEFQGGQWQSFFGWMGQQAGPDVKIIGDSLVNLLDTIPPLMRGLQPVSTQLLLLVDDMTKIADLSGRAATAVGAVGSSASHASGPMGVLAKWAKADTDVMVPLVPAWHAFNQVMAHVNTSAGGGVVPLGKWATGIGAGAGAVRGLNVQLPVLHDDLQSVTTALQKGLSPQVGYDNDLIALGDNAVTLAADLKLSAGRIGLHTQAQRTSFSAWNTQITLLQSAITSTHNLSGVTATQRQKLLDQLVPLQHVTDKTAAQKREINRLRDAINNLPTHKSVHINVFGSGKWGVFGPGAAAAAGILHPAKGMRVPGYGGGDRWPALLEGGEAVVDKQRTAMLAPLFAAIGVPGFAAGGLAGAPAWTGREYAATTTAIDKSVAAAFAAAMKRAAATLGGMGDSGHHSGSAAIAQAFARSIMPMYHWGPSQWPPWLYLGNRESGWNSYAVNASSGAYGIGQSLGHGHPYNLGDYANQVIWMANYIRGRYGSPSAAWGHELASGWYDQGGMLPPGLSLAYNGTGRPEPVGRTAGGGPLISIGEAHFHDDADLSILEHKLGWAVLAAGLG